MDSGNTICLDSLIGELTGALQLPHLENGTPICYISTAPLAARPTTIRPYGGVIVVSPEIYTTRIIAILRVSRYPECFHRSISFLKNTRRTHNFKNSTLTLKKFWKYLLMATFSKKSYLKPLAHHPARINFSNYPPASGRGYGRASTATG